MKNILIAILKDNTQLAFAWIAFLIGILMAVSGLFIPPIGIIDNSILIALGEFLAFSGALVGLHTKYSAIEEDVNRMKKHKD